MKNKITFAAQILLGLIFFVFGLNGFLNFIPAPTPPESAMDFLKGLMSTGYFFPVLKGSETICGLLLLTGIAAPVALLILAPIALQIALFHFVLTPGIQEAIMPLAILVLLGLSASRYWSLYRGLFRKGYSS